MFWDKILTLYRIVICDSQFRTIYYNFNKFSILGGSLTRHLIFIYLSIFILGCNTNVGHF